jgi:ABC-2 type transport system ATP-binding protein
VTIIRAGRAQQSGTLDELRGMTRTSITATLDQLDDGFRDVPGVHSLEIDGNRVHFHVDTVHLEAVLQRMTQLGVRSLESRPPTLEELFLRHYGDELSHETELSDRLHDDA